MGPRVPIRRRLDPRPRRCRTRRAGAVPGDGRLRGQITAALALVALIALAAKGDRAIWVVWVFVVVGLLDTASAVVQSMRNSVLTSRWA
jgi:hypothetical protein